MMQAIEGDNSEFRLLKVSIVLDSNIWLNKI